PSPVARQYLSSQDGQYNPDLVRQTIRQMEKSRDPVQKKQAAQLLKYIEQMRVTEKFNSLLTHSINVPKWRIEKQNADNSQMAVISFVRKPYADIIDSTVKVTESEIKDYLSKHKDNFKQDESRSISYVAFSAAPNSSDSTAIKNDMAELAPKFRESTDPAQFLAANGNSVGFNDNYILGKNIQVPHADSIKQIADGAVYGPYLDQSNYVLAKMVGKKNMPDTVKVRHILIKVADRQKGQMRDDSTAKKLADSIMAAVAGGADFNQLVLTYSDDEGSKNNKGEYTFGSTSSLVKNFYETAFYEPVGTKKVVKGESDQYIGYHYMEVMEQRNFGTGYKIAYLFKPVLASAQTDNEASSLASKFAGDSPNEKAFNETFEKQWKPKGYNKGIAVDIKPSGFEIMGLGVSRSFVRSIYEAKRGEVLQPVKIGSNYVVAVVTEVNDEGTQSLAKARPQIEPLLRNRKKAELIKKQIGNITTLEDAATSLGKTIETDSLRITGGRAVAYESKITGAAFNPANKGKVVPEPIEGIGGVYVVRVDNVMATASTDNNVVEQRKAEIDRMRQQASSPYFSPLQALKEAATIKDKRSNRY
ncbi:MAG TPA: peptidylprolyl isomerase, partial [Chitinophagaceae bacterium]